MVSLLLSFLPFFFPLFFFEIGICMCVCVCLAAMCKGHGWLTATVCARLRAVAMTRPKRHLCVIGDSETVGKGSKFLKRWMEHLEAEADLRYPDVADLQEV